LPEERVIKKNPVPKAKTKNLGDLMLWLYGSQSRPWSHTFDLVKDIFHCEPRGVIAIKGKGTMNAWLVAAAQQATS